MSDEYIDIEAGLEDLTPEGAELICLLRDLSCDFECENGKVCKDRYRCHADCVRAIIKIIQMMFHKERMESTTLVKLVRGFEYLTEKITVIEEKCPDLFVRKERLDFDSMVS